MDREYLEQIRQEVEQRWNELQDECKHLQGEHRLLLKLITRVEEKKDAKNQTESTTLSK